MSSSLRFGSHIKALSREIAPRGLYAIQPPDADSPDDAYNIVGGHTASGLQVPPELEYPSQRVAQSLLDTVLSSLGTVQHLLDPRSFSDRLASMDEVGLQRPRNLWDVEFLLVFAIGELLQGIMPRDSALPGARYFRDAVSHLPGFLTLRAAGAVGVEIMGLAAFYLQCADCKEDAYVYVGTIPSKASGIRADAPGAGRGGPEARCFKRDGQ